MPFSFFLIPRQASPGGAAAFLSTTAGVISAVCVTRYSVTFVSQSSPALSGDKHTPLFLGTPARSCSVSFIMRRQLRHLAFHIRACRETSGQAPSSEPVRITFQEKFPKLASFPCLISFKKSVPNSTTGKHPLTSCFSRIKKTIRKNFMKQLSVSSISPTH